jgi:glycerol uptake facilitator-like aquaporin
MSALLEEERVPTVVVDERPDLARRALMEAIGAFAIVVAGCGAIVADATRGGALGAVGISLVFGLIVMVMIYARGHLSGAHYNPSVTIAFTLARHFPRREGVVYIAAQGLGAIAGASAAICRRRTSCSRRIRRSSGRAGSRRGRARRCARLPSASPTAG